jgi:hypothetical protein
MPSRITRRVVTLCAYTVTQRLASTDNCDFGYRDYPLLGCLAAYFLSVVAGEGVRQ